MFSKQELRSTNRLLKQQLPFMMNLYMHVVQLNCKKRHHKYCVAKFFTLSDIELNPGPFVSQGSDSYLESHQQRQHSLTFFRFIVFIILVVIYVFSPQLKLCLLTLDKATICQLEKGSLSVYLSTTTNGEGFLF